MLETIITSIMMTVISAVVGVIGKCVVDWTDRQAKEAELVKEESAKFNAIEAIRGGVAHAQQLIVDNAKAAASDGKITGDELKESLKHAEDVAKGTALEIATGPALDYLHELSTNAFNALIDKCVREIR